MLSSQPEWCEEIFVGSSLKHNILMADMNITDFHFILFYCWGVLCDPVLGSYLFSIVNHIGFHLMWLYFL